jgi:hypothetical protein
MRFRIYFVGKRDNGGPNQSIRYGLKNCFDKVTVAISVGPADVEWLPVDCHGFDN